MRRSFTYQRAGTSRIAQGSERRGRQAIRKGLERFFEAFPDARWEELAFRRACSA